MLIHSCSKSIHSEFFIKTPRHVQQHCAVSDVILIKVSQFHVPQRHPIHDPDRLKVSKVVIRWSKRKTQQQPSIMTWKMKSKLVNTWILTMPVVLLIWRGSFFHFPCKRKDTRFWSLLMWVNHKWEIPSGAGFLPSTVSHWFSLHLHSYSLCYYKLQVLALFVYILFSMIGGVRLHASFGIDWK